VLIIFYCIVFYFAIRLLILWIKRIREERVDKIIEKEKVSVKMNLNEFWEIIEISRTDARDFQNQIERLTRELRKLTAIQIVGFQNRFIALKNKAYRWDLWGAIYLLQGGCSDDSFEYFREWLIGQGRERFDSTVKDPESVKDFVTTDDWEGLGYCAQQVYEEKTGRKYIPCDWQLKENPSGEEWEEEKLREMFPAIWNLVK
jgi:hypothetical protein